LGRRLSRQNVIAAISTLTAFALLVALIAQHAPPQHAPDGGYYGTTAPEGEAALTHTPTQHQRRKEGSAGLHAIAVWASAIVLHGSGWQPSAMLDRTLRGCIIRASNACSRAVSSVTQLWHAAGIIEASFQSSHDWRGRPRMVTGSSGAVSADHGRCSDMGAFLSTGSLCLNPAWRGLRSRSAAMRCCPGLQSDALFSLVGFETSGRLTS